MNPAKVIAFSDAKPALENSGSGGIYERFEYLRWQARLYARNKSYSDAIGWYEKAFKFGLQHIDRIENKDIFNMAWTVAEYAYDLPKSDSNFWTPIWIARKCLQHLNVSEDDLLQSVFIAWVVIKELRPFLESMPLDEKAALNMLELEKKHHPTFGFGEQQTPLLP